MGSRKSNAESGLGTLHDHEDGVCTGCGQLVDAEHDWCRSCAPEVYR